MDTDRYEPLDFLHLDELLSDEERILRDSARAWVTRRFLPVIGEHFEAGTFPSELIRELGELGAFAKNLPEEHGGGGVSYIDYGLLCRELERGDSGLRSLVSVQGSLVMWPLKTYGTDEQQREWLPRLASGEAIGCFGLTEPNAGSNPGGMTTEARLAGGEWILNGHKKWVTNGTQAAVAIVWAKVEGVVRGFVVPMDTPGLSAPEQHHKFSLRASDTTELVLEDVRLPESALLPGVEGLRGPLSCLTEARYGIAWGVLGAAQACYDEGLKYALQREVFDKPLAGFQLPQAKLAEHATQLTLAQLLALRLGRLKDEGRATPAQVSMAKRNNVRMALDVARSIRDLLGANGISLEFATGRHMLNLETVITYEGTHDIQTLALGHALTGIPAYR